MSRSDEFKARSEKAKQGGAPKYHEKQRRRGQAVLPRADRAAVRRRRQGLRRGRPARQRDRAGDLPADGVVTGIGRVHGRPVAIMANDSTVKAGSWGARTVEKIIRIQETAGRLRLPLFYLVDSAGARITDQIDMFPGRRARGAHLPQPGAAVGRGAADLPAVRAVGGGRRVHPGVLRRRVHGRQERVDVPRLAAHGRDGDRREGDAGGDGRRAHALRGLGLRRSAGARRARLHRRRARDYLGVPAAARRRGSRRPPRRARRRAGGKRIDEILPANQNQAFDMHDVIDALVDEGSFFELKKLFARELVTGFARLDGRAGRHRRQPAEVEGRRAVRRLGRQGGALHLAVRRVRACRCCSWPTCPAS